METNEDDRFIGSAPTSSESPRLDASGRPVPKGSRGKITSRPSRESILESYASQDEMRARDARVYSQAASRSYAVNAAARDAERRARQEALIAQQREQEAYRAQREAKIAEQRAAARRSEQGSAQSSRSSSQSYQPSRPQRRERVVPPLSSQESYDLTRSSMASYERARASRDALSESRRGRATNREVIDGRGSIDSRTFNESQQISAYVRDDRDAHDPMLDTMESRVTWNSRAGQGFDSVPDSGAARSSRPPRPSRAPQGNVGFTGVMSGRADYSAPKSGGIPTFLKVTIPVIVILLLVILYLVIF